MAPLAEICTQLRRENRLLLSMVQQHDQLLRQLQAKVAQLENQLAAQSEDVLRFRSTLDDFEKIRETDDELEATTAAPNRSVDDLPRRKDDDEETIYANFEEITKNKCDFSENDAYSTVVKTEEETVKRIRHNPYLAHAFDSQSTSGSLSSKGGCKVFQRQLLHQLRKAGPRRRLSNSLNSLKISQ